MNKEQYRAEGMVNEEVIAKDCKVPFMQDKNFCRFAIKHRA
jgi:hypothetical protein